MTKQKPSLDEIQAARGRFLPDILGPDLDVVFCGINPGLYSAAVGYHFARPGNRFWKALHDSGFTDELLDPSEQQRLLEYGCGLTNLVPRATAVASELTRDELRRGRDDLSKKIGEAQPRCVAVLGIGAFRTAFRQHKGALGLQEETLAGVHLWVLPNPSGLNAHYQPPEFARLFKKLRVAIRQWRKQVGKIIKAINANDIALVESELDKGMDINSTLYGGTLLMKSANLGTADMVKMLISRGANLNYRTGRGDDALSDAMSNSRHWQQVVPTLVEAGITIDQKTPIWKIAFKTKKGKLLPEARKMLEFLFAKGASPDSYTTKEKSTVIMYYAKKGWSDPLKFFLDHGANINARTLDCKTALSMALTKPRRPEKPAQKKERQAVVNLLRSKGAK